MAIIGFVNLTAAFVKFPMNIGSGRFIKRKLNSISFNNTGFASAKFGVKLTTGAYSEFC